MYKSKKNKEGVSLKTSRGEREGGFIVLRTANVTSPVIGNVAMD